MDTRIKALFMIVAVACWASCKKNGDAPTTTTATQVNLINASNNNINFYLNGTRINNTTTYYPGGTLGYVNILAGLQNYSVKIGGSSVPAFSKSLNFSTDSVYSLYVSGTTENDIFKTTDVLVADTGGLAKVRFVNASPDAVALNLKFEGTLNEVKFTDVSYKTTTPYVLVKAGIVDLAIFQSSVPLTPVSRDTVTLSAGGIYTYFGYGSIKNAASFGTGFIRNK